MYIYTTKNDIKYTFKVGGYFKVNCDTERFYCVRGVATKGEEAGDLWLDVYMVTAGVAKLIVKEPYYGYSVTGFSWRLDSGDITFSDTPFAPIEATEVPINKGVPTQKATPKQAKKTPPPATGGLFG